VSTAGLTEEPRPVEEDLTRLQKTAAALAARGRVATVESHLLVSP